MRALNKYSIVIAVLFLTYSNSYSQCIANDPNSPACNDIISTDVSSPVNTERPEMQNHFDWTNSTFNVYHPTDYTDANGNPLEITNPFFTDDGYLSNINFSKFPSSDFLNAEVLDFHVKDGWELIHKGNGFQLNEIDLLPTNDNRIGPYFILYNKYTGTLRTFAAFYGINAETMLTILKFAPPTPQNTSLKSSALFSKYEDVINPLDRTTDVIEVVQGSPATIGGKFFFADFKVAYDPCICNYKQYLNITFKTKNTSQIYLEGRLAGTNISLDGSGNSPLLNGRDFLSAVYLDDNFNVKGGMLTYNNIDSLMKKYETSDISTFQKLAISALGVILKEDEKPLDELINKTASKFLTHSFGGLNEFGITIADTLTVSFGAIGALTKQLTTNLSSTGKIPNISFIGAEMALTGAVKYQKGLGSGDIEIAIPGSLGTNNSVVTPGRYYPAYNESLGLFAVLNTPKVNSTIYRGDPLNPLPSCDDPLDYRRSFSFDSNSFKYTFNPASEPNLDKSRIYGALVLKIPANLGSDVYFHNANFVRNITDASGATFEEYITDFYPIESLHRAQPYFEQETCYGEPFIDPFSQVEISLRLQVFYSFKENRYGKENTYWEILTYHTNTVDNGLSGGYVLPSFNVYELPSDITINDTHYSSSTTIKAINDINIEGNITTSEGVEVIFMAGNSINVRNSSALNPNIRLIPKLDNIYGDEKIPPATNSYIKSFCATSGEYKANDVSANLRLAFINDSTGIENEKNKLIVYPNPTSDSFKVATNQEGLIKVEIYDMMGNLIFTEDIIGGVVLNVPITFFSAGIYLVKTTNDNSTLTKRVVVE